MQKFVIFLMVVFTGLSLASYTAPYEDSVGTVALWHMSSIRSDKYVDDDDSVVTDRNANLILAPNPVSTSGGPMLVDPVAAGIGYAAGNSAFGNCLRLDGINDSVTIANASLNFNPADVRIESWFMADTAKDGQILFDRWGQIVIYTDASKIRIQVGKTTDTGVVAAFYNFNYSTVGANPTAWTHLAVEVVGEDLDVYLNGTLAGSALLDNQLLAPSKTTTYIGRRYTGEVNNFAGYIDEFRITQATPEPATLALLGLGALTLRRKRR